ncbi:MAG: carboxypeptidase-like regulatory domain-containing protein [Bacteroidetes bacterium]|nr:carboxypeptidase-like regulatory domain-containing protein [Bacteroidota bacterium]
MLKRHLIILLFMLPLSMSLVAQDYIRLEGMVLSSDSLLPQKNVHIISRMTRSGTISDAQGRFTLRALPVDTIFLSAVGYRRRVVAFDQSFLREGETWKVLITKDTITMDEVVVRSFYDWPTFRHMFVRMPSIKPVNLESINEELKDILLYMQPAPMTIKGPIQTLYDLFNDAARLQRRLERNRRAYNQQLMREGRYDELIPEEPEHKYRPPE